MDRVHPSPPQAGGERQQHEFVPPALGQPDQYRHPTPPGPRVLEVGRQVPEWRLFIVEQIARNRALYADAVPGLALLPPASRRCVATALVLYSRILDLIEAADYDVFTKRQRVPVWEKLLVALRTVIAGPARTDSGQLSLLSSD